MKRLPPKELHIERYDLGNGKFAAKVFGSPRYFHKNGQLKHVDTHKLKLVDGEIDNGSDEFRVKVKGNRIKYGSASFEVIGLYVDDTLIEEPSEPTFAGNEILWKFTDVDIQLIVNPYSTRENIIFHRNPILGKNIEGEKIYVKYKVNGKLKTKEPYAFDAKEHRVPCFVEKGKKGIPVRSLYTYAFPITVDPTSSPNPTSDAEVVEHRINGVNPAYSRADTVTLRAYFVAWSDCENVHQSVGRSYIRYDLSAASGWTITSAVHHLYVTANNTTSQLRESTGEVDPETGTISTVWTYANGTSLGNITGTGDKTTTVTDYVNTHKGGYCDFGLCLASTTNICSTTAYSSEGTTPPYLYIEYTSGSTNINVSGVAAAGTGTAPTPTVSAAKTVAIAAAVALGVGIAPSPQVTAESVVNQNIQAVEATGTGITPTPSVSAISNINTTAVSADGVGEAPAPTITVDDSIVSVVAEGTAIAPIPTVSAQQVVAITGVEATGTGIAGVPTVTVESEINITAVVAEGSGESPSPTVTAGRDVSILAVAATTPTVVTNPTIIIVDDDEALHLGGGYYEKI